MPSGVTRPDAAPGFVLMGRASARPRPAQQGAAAKRLLTREEFRRLVFERDLERCVIPGCGAAAVDAHHIVPRRDFPDGGYYLANGVALCAGHHLDAEMGRISPDDLRRHAGITRIVMPPSASDGALVVPQ